MPLPKEFLDDSQTYSELGFPTGDKDNSQDAVMRDAVLGVATAVPDLINSLADTGKGIYDFTQGNPYEEIEIFDLSAVEEITKGSLAYEIPKALTQFAIPFVGWGKAATTVGVTSKAIKGVKAKAAFETGKAAIVGGLADITAFKAYEDNFFNLFDPLIDKYPSLNNPIYDYLRATTPEEAGFAEAKIRQFVSGIVPGEIIGLTGKAAFKGGQVLKGLIGRLDDVKANKEISKLILGRWAKDNGLNVDGILPTSVEDIDVSKIKKVYAASDDIDNLGDEIIPDPPKKISERLRENLKNVAASDAKALRETQEVLQDATKTTGRQKILPGTAHPTDVNKVRGYDGKWVTKKHFEKVSESRKGANEIRAQFDQPVTETFDSPPKLDLTTDTRGKGDFYHGAADEFKLDSSSHYKAPGLYGQGLYTTDDVTTAGKYQKKNRKLVKTDAKQTVYKITEKQPVKFFDLDQPVPQDIVETLEGLQAQSELYDEVIGRTFDEFKIGSYNKSTGKNPSLGQIFDELKAQNSANEFMPAYEIDNIISDVESKLRDQGFGGFTHQGGKKAGRGKRLHQVKIYWDPQDQLDINKVDVGGGGAVPPRKPPAGSGADVPPDRPTGVSQGKGPLKGTDTTPHQVNKKQVSNTDRQFNFVVKRIKQLKNQGAFSKIKTTEDTIDGGIKLLADSDKLREYAQMYSKIYGMVPTDELNYALAEKMTLITQNTAEINQNLINSINLKKTDLIQQNINELFTSIDDLDEWLRLGIPLRTEQGRGLRAMKIQTKGIDPAEWEKMTPAEKYKFNQVGSDTSADITLDSSTQSLKSQALKKKIQEAFEKSKQTGDFTALNKITNSIKRAEGNPEKIKKLFHSGLFGEYLEQFANPGLRIFNEARINFLLSAPTTQEINFLSGVLETYQGAFELGLGADNLTELKAAYNHLIGLHTDYEFSLKAFKQSWKMEDNFVNPGSVKADYGEKFAISMTGESVMAKHVNRLGKGVRLPSRLMTSMDAMIQSKNIIGATMYEAYMEALDQGLKGAEIDKYIKKQVDAVEQIITQRSGKGIKDDATKRIFDRAKEFGRRSTYTEEIRTDGIIIGKTAAELQRAANKVPFIRAVAAFVRTPTNLIKRQFRRTPVINRFMIELANDLNSLDPIVRQQARGQLRFSTGAGLTFLALGIATKDPFAKVALTGGGPDWTTTEGRKAYRNLVKNKWQPYSIRYLQFNEDGSPKIGEDGKPVYKYYSYKRLDPLSGWIGVMVDSKHILGTVGQNDFDEFTATWTAAFSRNFTDRTYLQGLSDFSSITKDLGKGTQYFEKMIASASLYSNLVRYLKRAPGDILDMVGIDKEDSAPWTARRDTKKRPGDKSLPALLGIRTLLNELSETAPGFGGDLPLKREHITNEYILYPEKAGFDLFNWVIKSESKNHPIFTTLAKLGQELAEPDDVIGDLGIKLTTQEYAELKNTVNTIKIGGLTLDQKLRQYMKTKFFKDNMAIVERIGNPADAKIAVERIMNGIGQTPGLRTINNRFIEKGELEWQKNNLDRRKEYMEKQRKTGVSYSEEFKKIRQESEL